MSAWGETCGVSREWVRYLEFVGSLDLGDDGSSLRFELFGNSGVFLWRLRVVWTRGLVRRKGHTTPQSSGGGFLLQ